jgi:osmotically-inducible protein OsmY
MRRRSIVTALVTIFIIAGVVYYFYSYRQRDISADFNTAKEYTQDATTTTAVKSALALNKQVSAFEIHVNSSNNNVTLTGRVPTDDDKRVAEEIARSTRGVANVMNNLQVDPKTQAAKAEKRGQP